MRTRHIPRGQGALPFAGAPVQLNMVDSIELTVASLTAYGALYDDWAVACGRVLRSGELHRASVAHSGVGPRV